MGQIYINLTELDRKKIANGETPITYQNIMPVLTGVRTTADLELMRREIAYVALKEIINSMNDEMQINITYDEAQSFAQDPRNADLGLMMGSPQQKAFNALKNVFEQINSLFFEQELTLASLDFTIKELNFRFSKKNLNEPEIEKKISEENLKEENKDAEYFKNPDDEEDSEEEDEDRQE